ELHTVGAEIAFAFYVMFFCAHCYHMRQSGSLSDNDWAGWLQWTKNAFQAGLLGRYWKEAEMQAWVDPAFREFVNREILGSSSHLAILWRIPWGADARFGHRGRRVPRIGVSSFGWMQARSRRSVSIHNGCN